MTAKFPRTDIGGISVSRLVIGTNWFLGFSHTTAAKDNCIKSMVRDRRKIADILEVFFKAGVDTLMGLIDNDPLHDAVKEAEDRTGVKGIIIATPGLATTPRTPFDGFNMEEVVPYLQKMRDLGTTICMPHQGVTDLMVDRCTREIRQMAPVCKAIRDLGMIPGLSTHMPETVIYADESGLDVETYIQIYNAMGFMMQVEVDWVARIIRDAKKPVITIKPMAAGQIRPFQGLTFVWNTIRPQDMVTIGTMTPDEAREVIDMSFDIIEKRRSDIKLQETRSKSSIKTKSAKQH